MFVKIPSGPWKSKKGIKENSKIAEEVNLKKTEVYNGDNTLKRICKNNYNHSKLFKFLTYARKSILTKSKTITFTKLIKKILLF